MADPNYTRVLFGDRAIHVPAWFYVQDAGDGIVTFVGASKSDDLLHPLRYGSTRTHQLIVGELIVRPHRIIATDALRGSGLAALVQGGHDIDEMLSAGEIL